MNTLAPRNAIHLSDLVNAQGFRKVSGAEEQSNFHQPLMDKVDDAANGGNGSNCGHA